MPHFEYEKKIATAELHLKMRSFQVDGRLPVRIVHMSEVYSNEFVVNGDRTYPGLIDESIHWGAAGVQVVRWDYRNGL